MLKVSSIVFRKDVKVSYGGTQGNPPTPLKQGRVAQSETCLIAAPGSRVQSRPGPNTFVEIDHEIISTAILTLPLIQGLLSVTS